PSRTDDQDQIESGSESELEDNDDTSAEEESVVIVGDEKQRLLQMVENSKHDKCEGSYRGVRAINAYRKNDGVLEKTC
ncbi:hypothetical protein BGX27_004346, partial [Mortierella sp. AM989]